MHLSSTLVLSALALGGCAMQTGGEDPSSTSTSAEGVPAAHESANAAQTDSTEPAVADPERSSTEAPPRGTVIIIDGVPVTEPPHRIGTGLDPDGVPVRLPLRGAPERPLDNGTPLPWIPH
jgi:hypothetical protein